MLTDMLNEYPKLSKYFDMNNSEIDSFLTNFAPKNTNNMNYSKLNSNKAKIPVSNDLKKLQFYVIITRPRTLLLFYEDKNNVLDDFSFLNRIIKWYNKIF